MWRGLCVNVRVRECESVSAEGCERSYTQGRAAVENIDAREHSTAGVGSRTQCDNRYIGTQKKEEEKRGWQ